MKKRQGFTLLELLVVIAIIALLLAVLIPSLKRAREQAKDVIDKGNLKQWGTMLAMYTDAYNGRFMTGWQIKGGMWMLALRKYYQNKDICLCPKAKTFLSTNGMNTTPFTAWGIYGDPGYSNGWVPAWGEKGLYGSYGINEWVHDPLPPGTPGINYDIPKDWLPHYWRSMSRIKSPSNVPVFADSVWEGTACFFNDPVPTVPAQTPGSGYKGGMFNFCIPRHDGAIMITYADGSVRKTALKQLWNLKWSPLFRTGGRKQWPAWMAEYKEEY